MRLKPGWGKKLNDEIARLKAEKDKLRAALSEHECPGDGSTDQRCYTRIIDGKKCTVTEALEDGK